eukprot:1899564-Amphidinium_carterae.1
MSLSTGLVTYEGPQWRILGREGHQTHKMTSFQRNLKKKKKKNLKDQPQWLPELWVRIVLRSVKSVLAQ